MSGIVPTALESETLRSQAARALRAQIIAGILVPGELYTIRAISDQLAVSATPVREAVAQLASEGLVVLARNRGFHVRVVTEQDLDEILHLRTMLEPPAIAEIAARGLVEDSGSLRQLAADISTHAAAGDMVRFLDVDRQFHLGMLAALGSGRLVELVGQLRDHTRLYGLRKVNSSADFLASADEHEQLLRFVLDGNADEARDLMLTHLEHSRGIWAGRHE